MAGVPAARVGLLSRPRGGPRARQAPLLDSRPVPCWTTGSNRRRPPVRRIWSARTTSRPSPEDPVADHPTDVGSGRDLGREHGWDAEYETYSDFDLPTYV